MARVRELDAANDGLVFDKCSAIRRTFSLRPIGFPRQEAIVVCASAFRARGFSWTQCLGRWL